MVDLSGIHSSSRKFLYSNFYVASIQDCQISWESWPLSHLFQNWQIPPRLRQPQMPDSHWLNYSFSNAWFINFSVLLTCQFLQTDDFLCFVNQLFQVFSAGLLIKFTSATILEAKISSIFFNRITINTTNIPCVLFLWSHAPHFFPLSRQNCYPEL